MIHDQYLDGDLSLTITDADLSKRGLYTCDCGGVYLCDVTLQVEALETPVQIKAGETLVLELDVADPVEVTFNGNAAAGPSSSHICTVVGGSLQCKPEYTQRASLAAGFQLRGVQTSDSGVYSIWDTKHNQIIHTYIVTVQDDHQASNLDSDLAPVVPAWKFFLSHFALATGLAAVMTALALLPVQARLRLRDAWQRVRRGFF
ncbi:hypothetical protein NFI96_007012 [Prochilodus magdalenae]|nr:hypothetical protein NFI96_007012 [Prochilodus magdalenae]